EAYPGGPAEYEAMARRLVGKLRVDYGQFPGDPGLGERVEDLTSKYPLVRELWQTPDLQARPGGVSVIRHCRHRPIRLGRSSYMPEGAPTRRVVISAPCDAASEKALTAIAADLKK